MIQLQKNYKHIIMTIESFFNSLDAFNTLLWGYLGTFLIITIGLFLSFEAKWFQIFKFKAIFSEFIDSLKPSIRKKEAAAYENEPGTTPLRAFFASIGGCIGIGNLVTISIAIKVGGPGALVWIWVVALLGMVIKYTEVYLGIKFRVTNKNNGYDGGPMYILQKAFPKIIWLPALVAVLMSIYGVEIFMFSVMKQTISSNWNINGHVATGLLIFLVFWGVRGGVDRIGAISSILIPIFVIVFLLMTFWILIGSIEEIPALIVTIVQSAFTGHAAVGGFAGSTFLIVLAKGFSSAAYSGDVGIGYASMMHAEARTKSPKPQARLTVFGIFLDTFIVCTCTVLLVTLTGVWTQDIPGDRMVQEALSLYFPYMDIFMPFFLFALGYSTLLPYMCAGLKAIKFVMPKNGHIFYYTYAALAFILFSFVDNTYALVVMSIAGGFLMLINIPSFWLLRSQVKY